MFYHFFYPLSSDYSMLNVFKYITFRSAYAGITALLISLLIGPMMIRFLKKYEVKEIKRTVTVAEKEDDRRRRGSFSEAPKEKVKYRSTMTKGDPCPWEIDGRRAVAPGRDRHPGLLRHFAPQVHRALHA